MVLLLMMTALRSSPSSWLALHLSKQVTKPVEALADAMAAIAAGNYGHRVEESATEELGDLVRSFNHMAEDLEGSRAPGGAVDVQLFAANAALEARRGELETMLETIPNGVATLDRDRRIVLANRALSEMLDPGGQQPFHRPAHRRGLSRRGDGGARSPDAAQPSHGLGLRRDGDARSGDAAR